MVVAGGGDNPLLNGGIAMATFAVEFLVKKQCSSLKYAKKLLDYFEKCEAKNKISKEPTGFFLRCRHPSYTGDMERSASQDEIVGMMLGIFYLYHATKNNDSVTNKRVKRLVRRLGTNLKENCYLIVPPKDTLNVREELQLGTAGLFIFQWAFERAFIDIVGNRYRPTKQDYIKTSRRILDVFKAMLDQPDTDWDGRCENKESILAVLYLWTLQGRVDPEIADQIIELVEEHIEHHESPDWIAKCLFGAILFYAELLDLPELLKDPWQRYLWSIILLRVAIYEGYTFKYFNFALLRHSLLFALESGYTLGDGFEEFRVRSVASLSNGLLKVVLNGERSSIIYYQDILYSIINRVGELMIQIVRRDGDLYDKFIDLLRLTNKNVNEVILGIIRGQLAISDILREIGDIILVTIKSYQDNDFYAAVIAKGLLKKFFEVDYLNRINEVIEDRERMWEDLPVGELNQVRNAEAGSDWHSAPVRYHNTADLTSPSTRIGRDFCWKNRKGNRILKHKSEWLRNSGITDTEIKEVLKTGHDVMFEAAGLGFMFPRILMSYWLNESVEFKDTGFCPLKAITCLPFQADDSEGVEFRKAICRKSTADWLLFSSTMV